MYVFSIFLILAVISGHVTAKYDRDLKGKVAVVTGGAKGIGYAITEQYLKAGVRNVTIVDKNLTRGLLAEKTLNSLYGNRVWFIHGDTTKHRKVVSSMIFKKFGYVDILVNNAGVLDEYDPVKTITTNLLATIMWAETFYNAMREDRGGKGGTIMNVASVTGASKDPFFWNYRASKYGILGLTFSLGHELNCMFSGVRVFAICPSATRTDMAKQQAVVDEQVEIYNKLAAIFVWQEPEVVGQAAVSLFKTATTGMAYTVEDGKIFVTPDSTNLTAEYLLSL